MVICAAFAVCGRLSRQFFSALISMHVCAHILHFLSAQRLDLFAWCVRLSRVWVGFWTHFKSLHFSFLFSLWKNSYNMCILIKVVAKIVHFTVQYVISLRTPWQKIDYDYWKCALLVSLAQAGLSFVIHYDSTSATVWPARTAERTSTKLAFYLVPVAAARERGT